MFSIPQPRRALMRLAHGLKDGEIVPLVEGDAYGSPTGYVGDVYRSLGYDGTSLIAHPDFVELACGPDDDEHGYYFTLGVHVEGWWGMIDWPHESYDLVDVHLFKEPLRQAWDCATTMVAELNRLAPTINKLRS